MSQRDLKPVKPESAFWCAVRELAAMRANIPEERRRGGAIYGMIAREVKP